MRLMRSTLLPFFILCIILQIKAQRINSVVSLKFWVYLFEICRYHWNDSIFIFLLYAHNISSYSTDRIRPKMNIIGTEFIRIGIKWMQSVYNSPFYFELGTNEPSGIITNCKIIANRRESLKSVRAGCSA